MVWMAQKLLGVSENYIILKQQFIPKYTLVRDLLLNTKNQFLDSLIG